MCKKITYFFKGKIIKGYLKFNWVGNTIFFHNILFLVIIKGINLF
jgi:hypothetical protein